MLEIQALTYNDLAPVVPIVGLLPEEGGTIGRGPQNAIVLPDPMRLVSRQHLQIAPEPKALYRLLNISSANQVYVNSDELLPGQACLVQSGDKIYVGGYVLLLVERQHTGAVASAGALPDVASAASTTASATTASVVAAATAASDAARRDTQAAAAAVQAQPSPSAPEASAEAAADMPPDSDDFLAALFADAADTAAPRSQTYAAPPSASAAPGEDPLEALLQAGTVRPQDPMQSLAREGVDLRSLTGKGDALINQHDGTDQSIELVQDASAGHIDALMGSNSLDPLALFGTDTAQRGGVGGLDLGPDVFAGTAPTAALSASNHGSDLAGLFQTPQLMQQPGPAAEPLATQALPDDFDAFLSPLAPAAPATAQHSVGVAAMDDAAAAHAHWQDAHLTAAPAVDDTLADAALADGAFTDDAEPLLDTRPMSLDSLLGPASDDPLAALLSDPEPEPEPPENRPAQPAPSAASTLAPPTAPMALAVPAPLPADQERPPPAATPARAESVPPRTAASVAPAAAVPHAAPVQTSGAEAALYQGLLKGLGLDAIPDRSGLDENFMFLIGQLLRCTSQGTVDLMAGRAVVKREVKANVTLIAPERNNPLKFSPDGEVALMYLLGRTYPGFMQPAEAMSSAYLDLRAHQIGLVSGMRSALGHVLDKFDPGNIDNDTLDAGLLGGLGYGRKAKLWDAYGRYYQATRDEAEDRFQEFFGAAFLKAYEEATQALKRSELPLERGGAAQ